MAARPARLSSGTSQAQPGMPAPEPKSEDSGWKYVRSVSFAALQFKGHVAEILSPLFRVIGDHVLVPDPFADGFVDPGQASLPKA